MIVAMPCVHFLSSMAATIRVAYTCSVRTCSQAEKFYRVGRP